MAMQVQPGIPGIRWTIFTWLIALMATGIRPGITHITVFTPLGMAHTIIMVCALMVIGANPIMPVAAVKMTIIAAVVTATWATTPIVQRTAETVAVRTRTAMKIPEIDVAAINRVAPIRHQLQHILCIAPGWAVEKYTTGPVPNRGNHGHTWHVPAWLHRPRHPGVRVLVRVRAQRPDREAADLPHKAGGHHPDLQAPDEAAPAVAV